MIFKWLTKPSSSLHATLDFACEFEAEERGVFGENKKEVIGRNRKHWEKEFWELIYFLFF